MYLFPLWHGYLFGVSCQVSICFYCGMGTHWECLVHFVFVSIVAWVLIGSVLSILYLFPLWHGYLLGMSSQVSICFYCGMSIHWECLVHCVFVSIVARVPTVSHFSYAPLIKCIVTRIINVIYLF